MLTKIVTTNLRIPDYNWLELKTLAAGQGVSVNEYLNILIDKYAVKQAVAPDVQVGKAKRKNIWAALRDLSGMAAANKPLDELSEDDKIIYET